MVGTIGLVTQARAYGTGAPTAVAPVDFTRISSNFNPRRRHPILNTIRAHRGVDYAAPRGTPVKAAGDGKVIFRGVKGGYGNTIIIQHGSKYSTLYAHLSRYASNLKQGSRVQQGQIIGYVGSSGLATGPHLHYEFRVNGVHRNPLTPGPSHMATAPKVASMPPERNSDPCIRPQASVVLPTRPDQRIRVEVGLRPSGGKRLLDANVHRATGMHAAARNATTSNAWR